MTQPTKPQPAKRVIADIDALTGEEVVIPPDLAKKREGDGPMPPAAPPTPNPATPPPAKPGSS